MRQGCRLPVLHIASVPACWVHESLGERHAVLRVLDPEGEPEWEVISLDANASDSTGGAYVVRAAGRCSCQAPQ